MASTSNLILNHFQKNSEEKKKSIYVTVSEKTGIDNVQLGGGRNLIKSVP